jgi:serine/threonine protein kinase
VVTGQSGTYKYMAPEQFSTAPYNPFKAEIYALGMFLFHLVFKTFPFETNSGDDLAARDSKFLYAFESSERNIHRIRPSKNFLDLLASIMAYNPE